MLSKKNEKLDYDNLNDVIGLSKKILKVLFAILILGVIFIGISLAKEIKFFEIIGSILLAATPFFIGLVIAWLFDPLVGWLQKKKVKRPLACIFVFFGFILIIYLLFRLLIPLLYKQINEFVALLPSLFLTVGNFIHELFEKLGSTGIDLSSIENNVYTAIENFSMNLTTDLPTTLINIVTGFVSSVGTFLIGLVVGFYLLLDFDHIRHILYFFPKRSHHAIKAICAKLNTSFRDFIQGTLFISLIVAIISLIGYSIVGLPSPLLFAIICGITNIIPYIGPWIGGGICALVGFTVSPLVGILTAVIAFVIQQIDSIVLQPLIMGKTMKLHPVTIMIGLLIFGHFFGVLGMILATPIIAGFKILLNYFDEKYDLMDKLKHKKDNSPKDLEVIE